MTRAPRVVVVPTEAAGERLDKVLAGELPFDESTMVDYGDDDLEQPAEPAESERRPVPVGAAT